MQIEIGDALLNTILLIILVGWGLARVAEVWLNVIEKVKRLWKRKEGENIPLPIPPSRLTDVDDRGDEE